MQLGLNQDKLTHVGANRGRITADTIAAFWKAPVHRPVSLGERKDQEEEGEEEGEEEANDAEAKPKAEGDEEDVMAMFDYEANDLEWRVDQQVFQPLREMFGFQDTRETEE